MYKSQNKIVSKFIKYWILFKDILTFLELDYGNASLITMYIVVLGIRIKKNKTNWITLSHNNLMLKKLKSNMFKMDVWTFWKRL